MSRIAAFGSDECTNCPQGRAATKEQDKCEPCPAGEYGKQVVSEGVEGLQNFLNEQGGGHQVMTAGDLKKKQEDLKRMRAEMEAEARFGGEL